MIRRIAKSVGRRIVTFRNPHAIPEPSILHNVRYGKYVDIGAQSVVLNTTIGDYTYIGPRAVIVRANIGRFCSIASEVHLGTGSHPTAAVSSHPIFYLARADRGWDFVENDLREEFDETNLGNDVWIGAKVCVRDGVRIGDGVMVGAGAVVVKDLEPYGIYGGVPAKLIRFRFPELVIEKLLEFKWWDREPDWLRRHAHSFNDINSFITLLEGLGLSQPNGETQPSVHDSWTS
jgi:acetyltransferase-like isoleucine patch superfamily enzyme